MANKYRGAFVTTAELSRWLSTWATEYKLHCALTNDQFHLTIFHGWEDSDNGLALLSSFPEMWLSIKPIAAEGKRAIDVLYQNKDCLTIQLPKCHGPALRETMFGWVTTDAAHVAVWQSVIARVKTATKLYQWDVHFPDRTEVTQVKKRASPDALNLYRKGAQFKDFFDNTLSLHEKSSPTS